MRNASLIFDDGKREKVVRSYKAFSNQEDVILKRNEPRQSIRGVFKGTTGVARVTKSASFLVPSIPEKVIDPPRRDVVNVAGYILQSIARWPAGGKRRNVAVFECLVPAGTSLAYGQREIPANFDLVVIKGGTKYNELGRSLSQCVPPGQRFCDSYRESCANEEIVRGCFVSRDWHQWYKANFRLIGANYSEELVCSAVLKTLGVILRQ